MNSKEFSNRIRIPDFKKALKAIYKEGKELARTKHKKIQNRDVHIRIVNAKDDNTCANGYELAGGAGYGRTIWDFNAESVQDMVDDAHGNNPDVPIADMALDVFIGVDGGWDSEYCEEQRRTFGEFLDLHFMQIEGTARPDGSITVGHDDKTVVVSVPHNEKYSEYIKHTNSVTPRLSKAWWELDNVYNYYSELRYSAFQMKCRVGVRDGNMPKEGCEALWQSAEDLEIHFREKMDERREELNADRDCIRPIADCKLLQLQLEECGA